MATKIKEKNRSRKRQTRDAATVFLPSLTVFFFQARSNTNNVTQEKDKKEITQIYLTCIDVQTRPSCPVLFCLSVWVIEGRDGGEERRIFWSRDICRVIGKYHLVRSSWGRQSREAWILKEFTEGLAGLVRVSRKEGKSSRRKKKR